MNNAATKPFQLPVRIARGATIRIKDSGDQDGGWSVMACKDRSEALRVMAEYPTARMPCWARIEAAP